MSILRSSMKNAVIFTLVTAVLSVGQAPVARAVSIPATQPTNNILISEIQTGGTNDATQEFVELYNPSNSPIDITGWILQYRAASSTSNQTWPASSTKATIACQNSSNSICSVTIGAYQRLVLARNMPELTTALPMSGGFSDKGGEIRLVQPDQSVADFVGYGTAQDSMGTPASAPSAGKSIKRKTSQDGTVITTGNNGADFIADCGNPTPSEDDTTILPLVTGCYIPDIANDTNTSPPASNTPVDNSTPTPTETPVQDNPPQPQPIVYPAVVITEVLPDPAPPQ